MKSEILSSERALNRFLDRERMKNVALIRRYYPAMDDADVDNDEAMQPGSFLADYRDPLAWHLAIGYLKLGRGHDAIPLLEGIIDRNEFNPSLREPAQRLLDRINEI